MRNVLSLICLLLLAFSIRPASASQWAISYQCNGSTSTKTQTQAWPLTSQNPVPDGSVQADLHGSITEQTGQYQGRSCAGTLTPKLTWSLSPGDTTLAPAPAQVNVLLTIQCNASAQNSTAYASDNYHDQFLINGTPLCFGTYSHLVTVPVTVKTKTSGYSTHCNRRLPLFDVHSHGDDGA